MISKSNKIGIRSYPRARYIDKQGWAGGLDIGWVNIYFLHSTACLILLGRILRKLGQMGCGAGQDDGT